MDRCYDYFKIGNSFKIAVALFVFRISLRAKMQMQHGIKVLQHDIKVFQHGIKVFQHGLTQIKNGKLVFA